LIDETVRARFQTKRPTLSGKETPLTRGLKGEGTMKIKTKLKAGQSSTSILD